MKTTPALQSNFDLQEAIENVYYVYKPLALNQRIEFYILSDLVSRLEVNASLEKLNALTHLIFKNTILYSGAGEISLSIRQLLQTDNDVLLEFCLTDDGTKLKSSEKGFAYFRALASAKTIIKEMGGKSEIMSLPGMNTSFKFIMRFDLPESKQNAEGRYFTHPLSGRTILIAEDNEINQKAIAKLLQKHGIASDIAHHGREAVDMLERNPQRYDLVIMDIEMPYMDGIQATNFIRKKIKSDVPVIGISAVAATDDQSNFPYFGMNGFITKPFSEKELIECIIHLLAANDAITCFSEMKIA